MKTNMETTEPCTAPGHRMESGHRRDSTALPALLLGQYPLNLPQPCSGNRLAYWEPSDYLVSENEAICTPQKCKAPSGFCFIRDIVPGKGSAPTLSATVQEAYMKPTESWALVPGASRFG